MKAKAVIESLFEATPDEYLNKLGIVRRSSIPTPPEPTQTVSKPGRGEPDDNDSRPDDDTLLAIKGDLINDLPDEIDFESMDGQDLIDMWSDRCIDGKRIRFNNIEELFNALGYRDFDEFFQDNEGAVEAILDFILDHVEKTKDYGDEGWWGMLVNAIKDAKPDDY